MFWPFLSHTVIFASLFNLIIVSNVMAYSQIKTEFISELESSGQENLRPILEPSRLDSAYSLHYSTVH
jgi:hypothetical protein